MHVSLPSALQSRVDATLADWRAGGKVARIWERDATLWTGRDEDKWLGWLTIPEEEEARVAALRELAEATRQEGVRHCLLLGMGGSSLGPEVFARTFGPQPGRPVLLVLDSTDPAQVRSFESKINAARTVFIVSSKSGSTLEPHIFQQYYFDRVRVAGGDRVGRQFVAITDPGSKLESLAQSLAFRHIEPGVPSIGGRYSVLSSFGMLPATVMGLDPSALLARAREMATLCRQPDGDANPGLRLGVILGEAALMGRDKLTILAAPPFTALGAWLEQLIAESTGKEGKGIIPVDLEPEIPASEYGADRVFVVLTPAAGAGDGSAGVDAAGTAALLARAKELAEAGHPVVQIELRDRYDLASEFFRWEFATAVAGAVLHIHPFDQPDVEASKIETKKLTAQVEKTGRLPQEFPFATDSGVRLFADARNTTAVQEGAQRAAIAAGRSAPNLSDFLRGHLARVQPGDYVAFLAYLEMNSNNERFLQEMRRDVVRSSGVATCLGFGPRFLHSTGQAYKGGPDSGVFLQITCDDAGDLAVPGTRYSFGLVKAAQARGDFDVLAQRGRRALRVHLAGDVRGGLEALRRAVTEATAR